MRRRLVAAATALALLAGGCGLSVDDQPQKLSAEEVPFDLLAPQPTSTTTSTTVPAATRTMEVFLVDREGRLTAVERRLPTPVTVKELIDALLAGATDDEAEAGLRSVIPSETRLLGVGRREDGRTVVLDFSAEPGFPQGGEGITAIAQVVFTASQLEGISGVTFAFGGVPTEVPRGDGSITSAPLFRRDFPARDPAATTTTQISEGGAAG